MKGTVKLKAATLPFPHLSPSTRFRMRTSHPHNSFLEFIMQIRATLHNSAFWAVNSLEETSDPAEKQLLQALFQPHHFAQNFIQFVGLTEEDSLSASWNGRDGIETAEVNSLSAAEEFCPEVETEWPEWTVWISRGLRRSKPLSWGRIDDNSFGAACTFRSSAGKQ